MHKNRIIAAFISIAVALGNAALFSQYASAADNKHTVTFLDFDGKVMKILTVADGENIDYSSVDTSSLHKHIDKYTEQDFSSWDIMPSTASSNLTIHALSKTAFISLDGVPAVTKYYSRSGRVDLYGFKAAITVTTQLPQKDGNGNYMTESSTLDITSSCTAFPSNLKEAFYTSDSATINIVPLGDDKPLYSYVINCYDYLGDVNGNGAVDSIDASAVLTSYADYASKSDYRLSSDFIKRADVNMDGLIDARDASYILKYYAIASAGYKADWNSIIPQ